MATFPVVLGSSIDVSTDSRASGYIVCPIHGEGCTKSRSIRMDREQFGPIGTRVFMGVWLEMALQIEKAEDHSAFDPAYPRMLEYAERKGLI